MAKATTAAEKQATKAVKKSASKAAERKEEAQRKKTAAAAARTEAETAARLEKDAASTDNEELAQQTVEACHELPREQAALRFKALKPTARIRLLEGIGKVTVKEATVLAGQPALRKVLDLSWGGWLTWRRPRTRTPKSSRRCWWAGYVGAGVTVAELTTVFALDLISEAGEADPDFARSHQVRSKYFSSPCSVPGRGFVACVGNSNGFWKKPSAWLRLQMWRSQELGECLLNNGLYDNRQACRQCDGFRNVWDVVMNVGQTLVIEYPVIPDMEASHAAVVLPTDLPLALHGLPFMASAIDDFHLLFRLQAALFFDGDEAILVLRRGDEWELVSGDGHIRCVDRAQMESFLADASTRVLCPDKEPGRVDEPALRLSLVAYTRAVESWAAALPVVAGHPSSHADMHGFDARTLPVNKGAFGAVYEARFKGKRVAVKEMEGGMWENWREVRFLIGLIGVEGTAQIRALFLHFLGPVECRLFVILSWLECPMETLLLGSAMSFRSAPVSGLALCAAAAAVLARFHPTD